MPRLVDRTLASLSNRVGLRTEDRAVAVGRVESAPSGLPWRMIFPDAKHLGATSYLRELAASDCSPLTVRSYAFDLIRQNFAGPQIFDL